MFAVEYVEANKSEIAKQNKKLLWDIKKKVEQTNKKEKF